MLTLMKIAITGVLACGKSTVSQVFETLGAHVVSADEVVHQLIASDPDVQRQIVALLGEEVLVDGKLDRKRIAARVFQDPDLLHGLEGILHPEVRKAIENEYQQVSKNPNVRLFVSEIPLLFESNPDGYDATITVVAEEAECRRRFGDDAEYDRRMARQLSQEEKAARADYVIRNDGTLGELEEKVKTLFAQLMEQG